MSKPAISLRRRLNLALLTLYGIGVTIGAGIYVLIGPVAAHAGLSASLSFVLAAIVMGLTVCSYAELCTYFPVAAGEAAYVKAAFNNRLLSTLTGLLMIATAFVAAATVAIGSAGYIAEFTSAPAPIVIAAIVVGLGLVSGWGVLESVVLASIFTVIEVAGLLVIVFSAASTSVPVGEALLAFPSDMDGWMGLSFASLLAFFAFTGFEDLTNMAEEVHAPERNVPIAMAITLVTTTGLYVLVAAIAVSVVPLDELASSNAPLSLVYHRVADVGPTVITIIAIVATLNTIIAQMIMGTRVIYGMARQGDLPIILGSVHGRTATPVLATGLTIIAVLLLAWLAPMERLAELTSMATLAVFALVNLALIRLRRTSVRNRPSNIRLPLIVPWLGLISSLLMMASAFV